MLSDRAFETIIDKIFCTDAVTLLKGLPDGCIDLVVTSPPYDNLRTYKGFTFDYQPIACELYRAMKPGGVVVWVVGDQTKNGCESLTSFKQAIYFVETAGFNLHDTMIWQKDGSPSPQTNRYLQVFEYMFIFSKGTPSAHTLSEQPKRYSASKSTTFRSDKARLSGFSYLTDKKTRVIDNVWYVPSGYMKTTKEKDAYEHPAMFPEVLAERHILTWSNPGDVVLDCFIGSGTTAKMARQNGRHFIGCDISNEYVKLAQARLNKPYTPPMFLE